ncbi:DUF6881 domain-containing protein [Xanthomonas arboricola]|uniref:DUF6881 domain-containing protein n=1 Tax=Xanthomonas arboricola TaxID=56448 RepID=UPI000CEE9904|nr:hypothetical protein [Xanthomonas arboricola]PPU39704.1 hypothetical protein XaplCFBP3123_12040 [Xanthomonas arboricola pv. populi]
MKYLKVKWIHSLDSEPVFIYSEIDENSLEIRKVEIYLDGRIGYASKSEVSGGSNLSIEPLPSMKEISNDSQFEPIEISCAEFEGIWSNRKL